MKAKTLVKTKKDIITYRPLLEPAPTSNYIYRETLPKNKRPFDWAQDGLTSPLKPKKFTMKPIKKLPVHRQKPTSSPTTPVQKDSGMCSDY